MGEVILLDVAEVAIHEVDCEEEGLVFALVGAKHLDHPVYHLGSEAG